MPRMSYEVLANRRLRRLIARPPAVHIFRFASNFGYIWVFKTWSLLHCMSLCCLCRCVLQWHSIREQRGTHKKGKEWRLVIHGPAKRWRMPSFSSVLLHIWCCYKTYTIKGLLLCPWCVVTGKPASPETQLYYYTTRTTTGHHATNHFFREKSRKNLDKLRFYWANMRKKHACF